MTGNQFLITLSQFITDLCSALVVLFIDGILEQLIQFIERIILEVIFLRRFLFHFRFCFGLRFGFVFLNLICEDNTSFRKNALISEDR